MTRARDTSARASVEQVSLAPPSGLSASTFEFDGDQFALLEWPLENGALPPGLTPAERDVAKMVLAGLSNDEIARRRGRSIRTVANQVAALFRKLQVSSRLKLYARVRTPR